MSLGKKTATYAATAAVAAIAIILVATLYAGPQATPATFSSQAPSPTLTSEGVNSQGGAQSQSQQGISTAGGQQALVLVQLTDPPVVPQGTTSLNLTYSAINLVVGEPSQSNNTNQVTTGNVIVTPQGGSATVDLLKLQNISQTIASANLPNGSAIYSVSFTVAAISIENNGVVSPVTLATGGSTFQVALARPAVLDGSTTSAILLELNPTVVNSPTGFQMIPTSVGILRAHSEVTDQDKILGSKHQLTDQDKLDLDGAKGHVSARLLALSVSGVNTTVTVQINNTGKSPAQLVAIGLHGNFTRQSPGCTNSSTTTTQSKTTTTTSISRHNVSTDDGNKGGDEDHSVVATDQCEGTNQLVFVPLHTASSSSTSTTVETTSSSGSQTAAKTCMADQMAPVNEGEVAKNDDRGLTLSPGQCVTLTFVGTISFGGSPFTVIPATGPGQTFVLHVIASNGAETMLGCSLPLGTTSCSTVTSQNDD